MEEPIKSLACEHTCDMTSFTNGASYKCTICAILKQLRKIDPGIDCLTHRYTAGDKRFKFMCSVGHVFVAEVSNARNGCRSCHALKCAKNNAEHGQLILDTKCVNVHEDSMLRLHCNRIIHSRNCTNPECIILRKRGKSASRDYAVNCTNFIACDQDFYATPRQLKYVPSVLDCSANHIQPARNGIIAAYRVFEMLFDDRFDDDTFEEQIEFTGYNRRLQIAFIHMSDKHAATYIPAVTMCEETGVCLVTIAKKYTGMSDVIGTIVEQLTAAGLLSSPKETVKLLRENINDLAAHGQMFAGRILSI